MKLYIILIEILCFAKCYYGIENNTLKSVIRENLLFGLDKAFVKDSFPIGSTNITHSKPLDCEELMNLGHNKSGIYTIWPQSRLIQGKSINVYCDMKTEGGGWTLIQRRGQFGFPTDFFNRGWSTYKYGFGELNKEFWLGNDNIYALTNQKLYSVRFDLMDVHGATAYALYNRFWIDDENSQYTLHIKEYSGDAGDSLNYHDNSKFSTRDKENDIHPWRNCAAYLKSGWWFRSCHFANLNGLNLRGKYSSDHDGIIWDRFRSRDDSLTFTEIKIRSMSYKKSHILNSQRKPKLQEINENKLK